MKAPRDTRRLLRRTFLSLGAAGVAGTALSGLLTGGCARDKSALPRFYRPKYDTVAHRILDVQLEHSVRDTPDLDYMLLDEFIDDVREDLRGIDAMAEDPRHRATLVLGTMDKYFRSCGFRYDSVRLLGQGLAGRGVNCDCSSALYLAMGEALGYPIKMVRAPGHTFVRWVIGVGDHVNWETTRGREMSDGEYIALYNVAPSAVGVSAMRSLDVRDDRDAILANAYLNSGVQWMELKDNGSAKARFLEANWRDPRYDSPCYNLGLVEFKAKRLQKAVKWCERAVALNENHTKSHMVLAVAYRALGRNDLARIHRRKVLKLDVNSYWSI